jgi:AcrR family transcriptional regulator
MSGVDGMTAASGMTAAGGGTSAAPGRRPGRPPKTEAGDTKRALLRAAVTLFAEKGYEGTSVRAIARAVGLSESVLYAHFDGKRAIFEAVLSELGPLSAITAVEDLDPEQADADPPAFIRALVARGMADWDTAEARQLISLMTQDGLIHDPALVGANFAALRTLGGLFARWIAAGLIPPDLGSPFDLAYELMSPIALARLLWLHGAASAQERAAARERAVWHAEFFIRAVFGEATPDSGTRAAPR